MSTNELDAIKERLYKLEQGQISMKRAVAENTLLTHGIKTDTEEIIQIFNSAKTVGRLFSYAGQFAKWVGGILFAGGAIWGAIKTFKTHL